MKLVFLYLKFLEVARYHPILYYYLILTSYVAVSQTDDNVSIKPLKDNYFKIYISYFCFDIVRGGEKESFS